MARVTTPRPLLLITLMGLLAGCKHAGTHHNGDDTGDNPPETFRVETQTVTSNNHGLFDVDFEVREGERVQIVLSDHKNGIVGTEQLIDPDGNTALDWEDWAGGHHSLTEAVYGAEHVSTLNWPIRAQDGVMKPGIWTLAGDTLDRTYNYDGKTDVDVTIAYRKDDALDSGSVHAILAYCTGVRDQDGVVDAIERGVAYWQELYAKWGVDLTVEYADIDVDPALPDTYEGVAEYQTLLAEHADYSLLMVVGDLIAGDAYVYGEAAAIPGPIVPTEISAVEISWIAHAGANGKFSDGEIGILGETMAHETGHYLGMFHPVEDGWQNWDAVEDTNDCTDMGSCEEKLGTNLMFPYPVCTSMTDCEAQDQLTDGQVGIMQRYVGVD